MKEKIKNCLTLAAKLATAALLALVACKGLAPMEAKAQLTPTSIYSLTNIPVAIVTVTATNIANSWIPVRQGKNMAFQFKYALSGSGTETNSWFLYPIVDGTNTATQTPFIVSSIANGTTAVVAWTNIPAAALQGFQFLNLTTATNGSSRSLYPSNWLASYGN